MTIETAIANTAKFDLLALAGEVDGKLKAIVAELVKIEEHTAAVYKQTHQAYCSQRGDLVILGAEDGLAHSINDAAYYSRYQVESRIESLSFAVGRLTDKLAEIEIKRKIKNNIETGKTTAAIDCGVLILSAHVKLKKGKPDNNAAVLYMLDGEVFEAVVRADEKTGSLSVGTGFSGNIEGAQCRAEGKQSIFKFLFSANMTAEEIGKAVDLRAKIIAAAKVQFDALPRKRSR